MASKTKLLKAMQLMRGHAQITNRQPPPRAAVPCLMQSGNLQLSACVPKRRLVVAHEAEHSTHTPLPVRIVHLKLDNPGLPVVIG